jgi:hypothetical protein
LSQQMKTAKRGVSITGAKDRDVTDRRSQDAGKERTLQVQMVAREGEAPTDVFVLDAESIIGRHRTDAR